MLLTRKSKNIKIITRSFHSRTIHSIWFDIDIIGIYTYRVTLQVTLTHSDTLLHIFLSNLELHQ